VIREVLVDGEICKSTADVLEMLAVMQFEPDIPSDVQNNSFCLLFLRSVREEHKLQVSRNEVPRKILGPKKDDVSSENDTNFKYLGTTITKLRS
jgi:hypothetical protein